ncbi:hypothetical protein CBER1_11306 [Cercospora berteroae]|uniref:Uncharacterized protein n=1 Tax=Cercospora berteroae TaxID=357750 RepID=A0A2S6BZ78_9PEZI|nr:hypothetical protein CBER1_11306 [Cercospora berteroae]
MEPAPAMDSRHESSSTANSNLVLESPELPHFIQALALELQDMILDYTLVASLENAKDKSPTNKIMLTSRYRFPWQLHLNRRTRRLVAHHYFAYPVFQLRDAHCCLKGSAVLEAWLINVDPLYIGLITKIRLDFREAKETCLYNLIVAVEVVSSIAML